MKKLLFFLILLYPALSLKAQPGIAQPRAIAFEYNDDIFSRNINLTYHHSLFYDRVRVYGGLKYTFNSKKIYFADIKEYRTGAPGEHFIFYQPYNDVFDEALGPKLGVEVPVLKSGEDAEVYSFYDFQYMRASCRIVMGGVDQNGIFQVDLSFPSDHGFIRYYEHHIGIGIRHRLRNAVVLKASAGVGVSKLSGAYDEAIPVSYNGNQDIPITPQFSKMFGVGLEYAFNHKASKARNNKTKGRRR